jgi:very-short-patch-repair endonuclease
MRRKFVPDAEIAAIAVRQGGVISHAQLTALGIGASAIDRRVRAGRLHRVFRGVFAVGHPLIRADGRRWAALLACGDGAVVSHRSAADAWGIRASASPTVDITVGRGGRARRQGIRLHTTHELGADEVTRQAGLPITTPPRTLLDLAATRLPADQLAKALDKAHRLRLIDFAELRTLLARYPRRPGTHSLNAQLSRYRGAVDTRSELEDLVNKLCDDHDLPSPNINCVVEGKVRDFAWPARRLVVEADSFGFHSSPDALNDDRERDVLLTLAGWTPLRFTYEQVNERPGYVVSAVLRALGTS